MELSGGRSGRDLTRACGGDAGHCDKESSLSGSSDDSEGESDDSSSGSGDAALRCEARCEREIGLADVLSRPGFVFDF